MINSTSLNEAHYILHISGHYVARSTAVKHLRVCTQLGVLAFQGLIELTCTIYHGVASAIFTGILPYCFLVFLLN
jgi:hypothetical protein